MNLFLYKIKKYKLIKICATAKNITIQKHTLYMILTTDLYFQIFSLLKHFVAKYILINFYFIFHSNNHNYLFNLFNFPIPEITY